MSDFVYEPPLTRTSPDVMFQAVRLREGSREVGVARWHSTGAEMGVAQILDFTVQPPHRRKGHGRRLMAAATDQCLAWHRLRGFALRRMWASVRQKEQVIARSFLMRHGFNHIASIRDLLSDEDALIYVRTFD